MTRHIPLTGGKAPDEPPEAVAVDPQAGAGPALSVRLRGAVGGFNVLRVMLFGGAFLYFAVLFIAGGQPLFGLMVLVFFVFAFEGRLRLHHLALAPALKINEAGILDRRVLARPLDWAGVTRIERYDRGAATVFFVYHPTTARHMRRFSINRLMYSVMKRTEGEAPLAIVLRDMDVDLQAINAVISHYWGEPKPFLPIANDNRS
ncbi:MAG: hypothetical protein AAGF19_00690 [Pseudomonadota bacterium]